MGKLEELKAAYDAAADYAEDAYAADAAYVAAYAAWEAWDAYADAYQEEIEKQEAANDLASIKCL